MNGNMDSSSSHNKTSTIKPFDGKHFASWKIRMIAEWKSAKLVTCVGDELSAAKKKQRTEDWLQKNESSILHQEAEKENLKHQIERLENKLKLKKDRFKEVLYLCKQALDQDDILFRDYIHIFKEMMSYIEEIQCQLLESQEELKRKENRIKDLESKIQENVDKSKNVYVAPTAKNNRLYDSLMKTGAHSFSSFDMGNVYDHLVPQTVQPNSLSLMHSERPMENSPFESPKNYLNFDHSTPNQNIHHDVFEEPKTADSLSQALMALRSNIEIIITPIQFRQDSKSRRLEDEHEITVDKSQNETVIFAKSMDSDERQKFICNRCGRVFYKEKYFTAHVPDCGTGMQSSNNNGLSKLLENSNIISDDPPIWINSSYDDLEDINMNHDVPAALSSKVTDEKQKFTCSGCDKSFSAKKPLKVHVQKCGLQAASKDDNGNEMKGSRVKNAFECKFCHKMFSWKCYLKRHLKSNNGERPSTCKTCGKSFPQKCSLTVHRRVHDGKRPFVSKTCSKSFTQKCSLRVHKRVHNDKKPFICKTCGKCFADSGSLKKHQRVHDGKRPYTCELCDKSFTLPHHLRTHQRVHDGKRPYTCEVCGKSYTQSGNLKKHQRIHDVKRPFICATCGETFTRKYLLKQHIVRVHLKNMKCLKCKICGKSFSNKNMLNKHAVSH